MAGLDIVEDRDPAFWDRIANHPEVSPHVFLGHEAVSLAGMVQSPLATPLRAQNGGFIFLRLDSLGRVHELHTLFTPEGWGREVLLSAKQAFARIFATGAQVIVTYEVEGWKRSQPPLSFGFKPAGDFAPALGTALRTWTLTRSAWDLSPARGRM